MLHDDANRYDSLLVIQKGQYKATKRYQAMGLKCYVCRWYVKHAQKGNFWGLNRPVFL